MRRKRRPARMRVVIAAGLVAAAATAGALVAMSNSSSYGADLINHSSSSR